MERLKGGIPALNGVPDPARVKPSKLLSLVAVETLYLMVERRL